MATAKATPTQSKSWDKVENIFLKNPWLRELHRRCEEGIPKNEYARFEILTVDRNRYLAEVRLGQWVVVGNWLPNSQNYSETAMFFNVEKYKVAGWREYMGQ